MLTYCHFPVASKAVDAEDSLVPEEKQSKHHERNIIIASNW